MTRFLTMLVVAASVSLSAAEITSLTSAAAQGPLLEWQKTFEQQSGHTVTFSFDTVPNLTKRIVTEAGDVLVATSAGVDQAVKEGRANATTRFAIGRIGVGVAVSRGDAKPDVSTPAALKAALAKVDKVVVSRGTSGAYVEKMLRQLAPEVTDKIVFEPSGVHVMARLGNSKNEIGFTMVSEIMHSEAHAGGGNLVAPLPAGLQNWTPYEAVVLTASKQPDAARQFIRSLGSPAARKIFAASGWQTPNVSAQ